MASFSKIGNSWRALVRRKGFKPICKTFRTKSAAQEWARRIEADIDAGIQPQSVRAKSIVDVILHYRELREHARGIPQQSNEHYMLAHLEEGLGDVPYDRLTTAELTGWCRRRAAEGAGPYTIGMELSKLGTVLRFAGPALGLPSSDVIERTRPMLAHLGLVGAGRRRERRPLQSELKAIIEKLPTPYADIVRFAVETAMRRSEIVTIRWDDVDEEKRTVLIRNRKHPRQKIGNDQVVPLLGEAWDIVQRQPSGDDRIFPVFAGSVSRLFLDACRECGIADLHFHDLRHEGTSRLFEQGFTIEQVALVTGHQDWRHLRRYTNLRPEDLHDQAARLRASAK